MHPAGHTRRTSARTRREKRDAIKTNLKVVEHSLEQQECSSREEARHENGCDPVDADCSGGAESKDTDGQEPSTSHGERKTPLRR